MNAVKDMFLIEPHSVADSRLFQEVTIFFNATPVRVKAYNIGGIIVIVSLLSAQLRFIDCIL